MTTSVFSDKQTHFNDAEQLDVSTLLAVAAQQNEGVVAEPSQAFSVETGCRTGRSPADRFIVEDDLTKSTVHWGAVNKPIDPAVMQRLWDRAAAYLKTKTHYAANLSVGADEKYALPVSVITEYAWHNAFAQHLFIRDALAQSQAPRWQILSAPGLLLKGAEDGVNSDGAVILDLKNKRVLLAGMRYAGEMKKAMFSAQNYFLPAHNVLPMHCSANRGANGDVALFFGLSGTGKTTLSADPKRQLIGDDEHGWSAHGVFNLEGGCYAKCIDLSEQCEPVIWQAIRQHTVLENVVLDDQRQPCYSDARLSMNSRAAYPRDHIPNCVPENQAGHPNVVIFLTCDCNGVLPPVARLTKEQAAYHFLSGYTAKVGSTEVGSTAAIESTFSTCFGAPFFPRSPTIYAQLLIERLTETGAKVFLINTGWTGGAYGEGERFSIPTTRAIVDAVLAGQLNDVPCDVLPGFSFAVPKAVPGVDSALLMPAQTWSDQAAYQERQNQLIQAFVDNFKQFDVPSAISSAGPVLLPV